MNNYKIITLSLILIIFSNCSGQNDIKSKALKIHSQVLTIDTHTDTPFSLVDSTYNFAEKHDPRNRGGKVDLVRMKEGGLDAVFLGVFVSQGPRTKEGNENAIASVHSIFSAIFRNAKIHHTIAEIAITPDDAYRLKKEGKRALYIGIENGYAIGNDISLIGKYYKMGARYITLCHSKNNDICTSSTDTTNHKGLSEFGKKVVIEMNRLGMLVDVSHISDEALIDVLKITKVPVFASHSCAKAVCNNPRNLSDSMLLKLKENGGVIQMCILSDYVKKPKLNPVRDSIMKSIKMKYPDFSEMTTQQRESYRAERRQLDKQYPPELATVADIVDHIDHIVKVIGIDYVGIGTDFDGGGGLSDCYDASELPNITIELVKRGYSKNDIEKIWSGNFMRVFRKVQEFAAKK